MLRNFAISLLAASLVWPALTLHAEPVQAQALQFIPLDAEEVADTSLSDFANKYFGDDKTAVKHWQVLSWDGSQVRLAPFKGFRKKAMDFDWARQHSHNVSIAPDVDAGALFIFRTAVANGGGKSAVTQAGQVWNEGIREGWKKSIALGKGNWELSASYIKNGGKILPGSMQLTLREASTRQEKIVLDRSTGSMFSEQKMLWVSDLNGDGLPDFLIQRTLLTGEIDYVLSVSDAGHDYAVTGITIDPDQPQRSFSSGAGEAEAQRSLLLNSPKAYPVYILPVSPQLATAKVAAEKSRKMAYTGAMPVSSIVLAREFANSAAPGSEDTAASSSSSSTNGTGAGGAVAGLLSAQIRRDFVFSFNDEKYRILVESLPAYYGQTSNSAYTSTVINSLYMGGRNLVVSLFYKGKKQVLLVTGDSLDGADMTMSAGDLDGSGGLSISINWMPHYNNGFSVSWRKTNEGSAIMRRTAISHSQGC